MKFAITAPVWAMDWTAQSDFLFVLAQYMKFDVYSDFVKYWRLKSAETIETKFYGEKAYTLKGKGIMLDNGAYENELQSPEEMIEIANVIKPDIIVSPDRYRVMDTTIELTTAFLDEYKGNAELMVVPQGKDDNEWIKCYFEVLSELSFDWIGLPRWLEDTPLKRIGVFRKIRETLYERDIKVHLLGLPNPTELRYYRGEGDIIKSVDTSWPFTSAKQRRIGKFDSEHRVDMLCMEAIPGHLIQAGIDYVRNIIAVIN